MRRWFRLVGITLLAILLVTSAAATGAGPRTAIDETEPNDTPATANPIASGAIVSGTTGPGDLDYFALRGTNTTWGFVARLHHPGGSAYPYQLQALSGDGVTLLAGQIGDDCVFALQAFAGNNTTHYLRVDSGGLFETPYAYELRYAETVVAAQPEVEPNNTAATGTPFSFTNAGSIDPRGDKDCFLLHGREGDRFLLALDTDPEGDGNPCQGFGYYADLYAPSGERVAGLLADYPDGATWTEPLTQTGAYALCVTSNPMCGGPGYTYKVGVMRNDRLYVPDYRYTTTWLEPGPDGAAHVGDLLTFSFCLTNSSPITIPGALNWGATFDAASLEVVGSDPPATESTSGFISWQGQRAGLLPGETYSVTFTARALKPSIDSVHASLSVDYYFTGHGGAAAYRIWGDQQVNLPLVRMAVP